MNQFFKNIFTEVDNQTFDYSKVLAALYGVSGVFLQGWHIIYNHAAFDMTAFGQGSGMFFAGVAAIFHFKKDSNNGA